MRSSLVAFVALALLLSVRAFGVIVEDPLRIPGFAHFYNLEYDQAIADFSREVAAHPSDPDSYNHLSQALLYREMLRNGTLESQIVSGSNPFIGRPKMKVSTDVHNRFFDCVQTAISISQKRVSRNPKDLGAHYAIAVAQSLRANYLFLVEKSWHESLKDATAARKNLQLVLDLDPSFVDARLGLGIHDYIVGSLPFMARAVGLLAGIRGDKEGGIQEVELVSQRGILNRYDAEILLAILYRREHRPSKAIPLLLRSAAQFPRNYLLRFELVQMYSDLGDKKSALQVLKQLEELRLANAPGFRDFPLEKIAYSRGNLFFWYGDIDPAISSIKQATKKNNGLDLSTTTMAWLRLGQLYDLKGNHAEAKSAYQEVIHAAPDSELASEAKVYLENGYKRKEKS